MARIKIRRDGQTSSKLIVPNWTSYYE